MTGARRERVIDALVLVAFKLAIAAWILHAGFTHVSDDDYARTVIAERFAHAPRFDPSGTSWLPFPFWVEGAAMMAFGATLSTARAVAVLLGAASAAAPYLAMRAAGVTRSASIAAVLVATSLPWNAWLGVATVPEGWVGALVGAGIVAMTNDRARPWTAAAFAVGALSRYETWPACAALAVFCAWKASHGGDRKREAGCAALALVGPCAWMLWNAHAHGSALHFLARVTAFRLAAGGAQTPLSDKILDFPRALFDQAHVAGGLALLALSGFAIPSLRARWAWPCATALAVLVFLVWGDAHDGAPTHHPARALVAVWWIVVAAGCDSAYVALSRLAARGRRTVWIVGAAACAGAVAASAARWSDAPGETDYDRREPQIARGLDMRARAVAAAHVSPCSFEHFALLAAWGEPERATIDPPSGAAPTADCPRVVER